MPVYYVRAKVPQSKLIGDIVESVFDQAPPIADLAVDFNGTVEQLREFIKGRNLACQVNGQVRVVYPDNVMLIQTTPLSPLQ